MPLQKIEWLQREEVSSLSGVSSLLGVFEGAPVRVPASLLSIGLGLILALRCGLARGRQRGLLMWCLMSLCRLRVFFYFVFLT